MADELWICIVEDDAEVRGAYRDLMRSYGISTYAYESAEEFLAGNCDPKIDCLILDHRLPGMNGLELQTILIKRGQTFPIVFVTSDESPATRAKALANGAERFINKPVSADELMKCVFEAIE